MKNILILPLTALTMLFLSGCLFSTQQHPTLFHFSLLCLYRKTAICNIPLTTSSIAQKAFCVNKPTA